MFKLSARLVTLLGAGAIALAVASAANGAETTVSGTLVDVAKWVSGDSTSMSLNMPSVMMSGMSSMMTSSGGMMANSAMPTGSMGMAAGMMGCHATLGVVTSGGELYVLLANQASPMGALSLCGQIGQQVTVTGSSYTRGGVRAILVSKLPK